MELRTYRIAPFLYLRAVRGYTNEEITDMLTRAECLGFNLNESGSPLEDLTLAELDILTREAGDC